MHPDADEETAAKLRRIDEWETSPQRFARNVDAIRQATTGALIVLVAIAVLLAAIAFQ